MMKLYGKGAAMIHGMETAVQMSYDRTVDIQQPKFWPNMPLKIVFSQYCNNFQIEVNVEKNCVYFTKNG